MKPETNDVIQRSSVFLWIVLATGLILLVPLVAMQFTNEVNWSTADFVVMGALLLGTGCLFVFVARRSPRRRRIVIGMMFAAAFLLVWAELAVGIFSKWGS